MWSRSNGVIHWLLTIAVSRLRLEYVAYVLNDQIDGHVIIGASRDDHIGVLLRWLTEVFERRFDMIGVAGENVLEISAVLFHVTKNATCQTRVGVGVDE